MVTHDREAAGYGDRLIHIRDGLIDGEEDLLGSDGSLLRAHA
jgi:ABC-type lipoprotein export system ATPase subunit